MRCLHVDRNRVGLAAAHRARRVERFVDVHRLLRLFGRSATRRRPRARDRPGRGRSRRASASVASSSVRSSARNDAPSSCSSVRGPMIGPVTPFCCSNHASATAAGSSPRSAQSFSQRSSCGRMPLVARLHALAARGVGTGAAQHAARERAPRDDAEPVRAARGQHFELDRARREVVEALLAHEPEEVARLGRFVRLRDVPAREVAAADVDDLALLHERLHRLPDLVPRRGAVDVMHLVQVDVIGLQPAEALVARGADVSRRQPAVVRPLGHRAEDLGREHDLLAASAALREPAADDLLGRAGTLRSAVAVRGVEEVDPELERAIHDLVRVGLARERAEVHRAEADRADAQRGTSETSILHGVLRAGDERSPSTLPTTGRFAKAAAGRQAPAMRRLAVIVSCVLGARRVLVVVEVADEPADESRHDDDRRHGARARSVTCS